MSNPPTQCYLGTAYTAYNSTTACLAECLQPKQFFSSDDAISQCFNLAAYGNAFNTGGPCNESAASPLVHLFDTCMQDYCQHEDQELGGCNYTSISTSICRDDDIWHTLCNKVSASVNADIGGIGVVISYIMQIIIALVAWIILSLKGSWFTSIYRKWSRAGDTRQEKRSTKCHPDQAAVLKSMLVEFQEAQCFFMLATQIAVLISFGNQAKFYGPKDEAQLDMDNYLGQIIGTGGLLPISLVLFTLNNIGMISWYILILSGITLATSSATVIISTKNEDNGYTPSSLAGFYDTASIDSCGGYPPPIVFCDEVWYKSTISQYFDQKVLSWTYIFPLVVFSVILSQLLLTLPRLSRFVKGMLPRLSRLEGSKLVTYLNVLWIVAISILYLFAIYSYLANLYYLNKFGAIDTSNWTLGQIVAVTIWAPVLLKYIYSACFGIEAHSRVRFAKPYELTKSNHSNPQIDTERGALPEREIGSNGNNPHEETTQHGYSKIGGAQLFDTEAEV